jgi:ATP-dependent DNA ligase
VRGGGSGGNSRTRGLEGLVSKPAHRPYQAGRSKHWMKVKNCKHPAIERRELFAK